MDNQTKETESIKGRIMNAVESGKIKMRPQWHFVLRAILWLVGFFAVFAVLLYLFSLFLFISRRTGIWIAPIFGLRGLLIFLTSLPWLLIAAVLAFIIILEILVRHYSFAYRLPLLYSAFGILLVVVAGGMLLAGTPLHEMLSHCPPDGELAGHPLPPGAPPCGTGFYRDLDPHRFNNIHEGVITAASWPDFSIENRHGEILTVVVTPKTRLPYGEDFSVGDAIMVIGDQHEDRIEAFGIGEINH